VSDAAVHPNGTGTCVWTIWGANSELWSREGYVPGTIANMYSGLAEAYGIYTVISFFNQYLTFYPLILPPPQTIHMYCDNNGVIEHLQNMLAYQYPHDGLQVNYPVFAAVQKQVTMVPSMHFLFHHIKGHQKETSDQKLTLPEKLNIDCDA